MGFEATLLKKNHGLVLGLEKAKMALFCWKMTKSRTKWIAEDPRGS
jgi:hypothetical protein